MRGEPTIVVENRKELTYLLSQAAELEHGLMCEYLYAAGKLGEDRLFIGPAYDQADETAFGWPDLQPITGLAGACRAIERIVEQGEGAREDWANAHYGRFLAVLEDYRAMRREDPAFEPAHPVVAAAVRGVEGIEPDVYISDPATARCSDLFNAVYELLLQMIARYFAFGHDTPDQRHVLAHTAVELMFEAIKPLGLLLAALPVGRDQPGLTAGASFQLPYRASFLLPHHRSAWLRFAERLDELAGFADGLRPPAGADVAATVTAALRRAATSMTADIETI